MAAMHRGRPLAVLGLALLGLALAQAPAQANTCPFCIDNLGPTLAGDFNQASIVIVGTVTDARRVGKDRNLEGGTTTFRIDQRLKDHPLLNKLANKDGTITLPCYLPQAKARFLIFCDVYKNNIDPYRGVELVDRSEAVDYLLKAVALKDQPIGKRLRHCFDYLNSADTDVSMDAYREFAKAEYHEYRDMAKTLPPDVIAGWLQDPKTPGYRYGLYASLLSLCGDGKKHGDLLRAMIDDPKKRQSSGIDGLMAGLLILQPKEGWKYLETTLGNEQEEFLMRYSCLSAMRFFWGTRPDVYSKEQLIKGMTLALRHSDMADFAVEDLRKWRRWELTPTVIGLFDKDSHNLPVIKRSILRFALQAGKQGKIDIANKFVAEQRRLNEEWVKDTESLLEVNQEATPPEVVPAKK
jgi:hypothetical protein